MIRSLWLLILLPLVGCQTLKPTRVYEAKELDFRGYVTSLKEPIVINRETVVLDTRSPLDFGLYHIPGSRNVQWDAFRSAGAQSRGVLESNLDKITRRLALLGVRKDSQVVVVGEGLKGLGQEARLAWMLMYLGVLNVQTADFDSVKAPKTNLVGPPTENAPVWEAEPVESLIASRKEVLNAARLQKPAKIHIIDARTEAEFFQKQPARGEYVTADLGAVNIEWKEFFTPEGRPKLAMRQKLHEIGIGFDDRIVVISNQGLRSAAVTYALTMLGFKNAGNFAGGWTELSR